MQKSKSNQKKKTSARPRVRVRVLSLRQDLVKELRSRRGAARPEARLDPAVMDLGMEGDEAGNQQLNEDCRNPSYPKYILK